MKPDSLHFLWFAGHGSKTRKGVFINTPITCSTDADNEEGAINKKCKHPAADMHRFRVLGKWSAQELPNIPGATIIVPIPYDQADNNFIGTATDCIQMRAGKVISISKVKSIANIKPYHSGKPIVIAVTATGPQ